MRLFILLFFLVWNANSYAQELTTSIFIQTKNAGNEAIALMEFEPLGDFKEIARAFPDENGKVHFTLEMNEPKRMLVLFQQYEGKISI